MSKVTLKENEREARMNCGKLLAKLEDNLYDQVTVWSDSSHSYLVVNSIDEYEDKEEKLKKDITKLSVAALSSLLIAIVAFSIPNEIISVPFKAVIETILIVAGITFVCIAIKDNMYKTKIKAYLEAARKYLEDFKPILLSPKEDKTKAKK